MYTGIYIYVDTLLVSGMRIVQCGLCNCACVHAYFYIYIVCERLFECHSRECLRHGVVKLHVFVWGGGRQRGSGSVQQAGAILWRFALCTCSRRLPLTWSSATRHSDTVLEPVHVSRVTWEVCQRSTKTRICHTLLSHKYTYTHTRSRHPPPT